MNGIFFTAKAEREMERIFALRRRAIALLDIVNAEFKSDPQSVACFDLRIVREIDAVLTELRKLAPDLF